MTPTKRFRPSSRVPAAVLASLVLALASPASRLAATTIMDDFNDGNADGWTEIDPLSGFGAGGTFAVENGAYRFTAPGSPNPAQLGQARVGAFRQDVSYTGFEASVDVVDWGTGLPQDIGILARLSDVGLGTTNGYTFTLEAEGEEEFIALSVVTGEIAETVDSAELMESAATEYRLVLRAEGGTITGSIFAVDDLSTLLAEVSAPDTGNASGFIGIFTSASGDGTGAVDATFDNFSAAIPEPSTYALLLGFTAFAAVALRRRRAP